MRKTRGLYPLFFIKKYQIYEKIRRMLAEF